MRQGALVRDISFPRKVYILGGGNVGLGLAMALEARDVSVLGLWNRSKGRAAEAARRLRCPVTSGTLASDLGAADLILLAVSDSAIPVVAATLPQQGWKPGAVLAHVSGFLPASVLPAPGPSRGSLHPLLACPTPDDASRDLPGAFYALEGEEDAVAALRGLTDFLGARSKVISAAAKPRYHAAGVLASNGVIALLKLAVQEAAAAGLDDLDEPLTRMALGAVTKAAGLGISEALTGPALRGDLDTVRGHISAISLAAREVYRPLTSAMLAIATQRGLASGVAQEMARAMEGDSSA